jgi:hypothetical protein
MFKKEEQEKNKMFVQSLSTSSKWFSLHSKNDTNDYDSLIVPLLHRISNLEKLNLDIICYRRTFIDSNELKRNILNYMTRLKSFTFIIYSHIDFYDRNNSVSNDIQICS